MKTVLKYPVAETGITTLHLREGFKFVRFEYVLAHKALYAWFEEPLKADIPQCDIQLKVINTGDPIQDEFSYLSTALDALGPEAYHLYQLEQAEKPEQGPGADKASARRHKLQQVA